MGALAGDLGFGSGDTVGEEIAVAALGRPISAKEIVILCSGMCTGDAA